jgi:hypothetical protein
MPRVIIKTGRLTADDPDVFIADADNNNKFTWLLLVPRHIND